ncbi:MAG: hypothetical protein QOI58_4229 [Thermoanaerobaculia bacterium]|jgi:hypothetical protein|nr:hypothetical protein [Thermoanaerobaculia bacterium]
MRERFGPAAGYAIDVRRTAIAAAWIFGTTVPLLASVVWVFGCCVLPFHAYIHKAIPLCHVAIGVMTGEQHGSRQQQVPASKKQEPPPRMTTDMPRTFQLSTTASSSAIARSPITAYRNFIALGAVRCDRDVGLHLLIVTFLI